MKTFKGDPVSRAFAAYFKTYGGPGMQQPSNTSGIVEHDGKQYVVLHSGRGYAEDVLAVYRIQNNGALRAMKRWPAELTK